MLSFYPSETTDVWACYLRAQVTQGASNHMATEPWCDGEDEDEEFHIEDSACRVHPGSTPVPPQPILHSQECQWG